MLVFTLITTPDDSGGVGGDGLESPVFESREKCEAAAPAAKAEMERHWLKLYKRGEFVVIHECAPILPGS